MTEADAATYLGDSSAFRAATATAKAGRLRHPMCASASAESATMCAIWTHGAMSTGCISRHAEAHPNAGFARNPISPAETPGWIAWKHAGVFRKLSFQPGCFFVHGVAR